MIMRANYGKNECQSCAQYLLISLIFSSCMALKNVSSTVLIFMHVQRCKAKRTNKNQSSLAGLAYKACNIPPIC